MVYEDSTDWLHTIPRMELAINNSVQNSTGLSPAYIVYGTPIRIPVDMLEGVQGGTAGIQEVQEMQEIQELGDPGPSVQVPTARLKGLEAPIRQA